MTLEEAIFVGIAFLVGSLPFSLWVGFVGPGVDIREYGDGNPGTFNVIRASGLLWGGLALMLDISKGAAPVGLAAQVFGFEGTALILTAFAPMLGHAFSPFLGFQGGKAIATTAGVLIGLSLWELPLVAILSLTVWSLILNSGGWAVLFTIVVVFTYLLMTAAPSTWFASVGLIAMLLLYKHRADLRQLPRIQLPQALSSRLNTLESERDDSHTAHHSRTDRH